MKFCQGHQLAINNAHHQDGRYCCCEYWFKTDYPAVCRYFRLLRVLVLLSERY